MTKKFRPIAIHLPQFHPIKENDEWWGKGFTEWHNVAKAKPLFEGHYQPHLPADLGFYDLRLEEARVAQADLAKNYGIEGFCYYHYWFNGKRVLERPVDDLLKSGKPDFPFMLCWANENWTRAWDGLDKQVLLQQNYSEEDDLNHINALIPFLKDPRYIRIDGKPVLAVYRSKLLPNPKKTLEIWRREAEKQGLHLYMCRFENFSSHGEEDLKESGFDAAVDFQPFGSSYNQFQSYKMKELANRTFLKKIADKGKRLFYLKQKTYWERKNRIWDYQEYSEFAAKLPIPKYSFFPGITPGFDNYARKKENFFILKNSSPQAYGRWLKHIIQHYHPISKDENLIFINAWNEWAEGNHLEPCQKWGKDYLEITKEVLNG